MAKNKEIRTSITIECIDCAQHRNSGFKGVSRYITQKNRRNTPNRLELKKFCSHCCSHTVHKEIKK